MVIETLARRQLVAGNCARFGLLLGLRRVGGVMLCSLALGCLVGCAGGGYSNPPPPPNNPTPSLASGSLSPSSVVAGGAAFTLTVTGTNFVSSSTVQWNGNARTTTFVSSTSLQAAITAADIAAAGTAQVSVSTPSPGGGSSSALTFTINNPAPAVESLNISSTIAGGAAFTLTVTGTGFVSSSTVQWNGSARTTTFVSSTSLQAAITAADIATGGTAMVTVSNPAPGGGVSSALNFTINNPVPTITSLNPSSAFTGGAGFTLTVTGTNFLASSTVQWNGSARTTTFVSSTSLQAAITAADISVVGAPMVTVSSPAPGGGISSALAFTIKVPAPAITLLNPSSAIAGGASFTLTVNGNNFVSSSTVQWNGSARTTTFVSSSQLQAAINAADLVAIGVANVTVANPAPNGGTSAASSFFVGSTGGTNFAVIAVNQAAKDIVFDHKNQVFYLSVTGTDANHPNTISILDPATGTVTASQPSGSNPNVLAISDDSQFLYAGIDGSASVQRFILPGLVTDINYPLAANAFGGGPFFALDLQVAPGAPHTTAVTLAVTSSTPSAQGGITIFDDGTARPTTAKGFGPGGGGGVLYDSIQWGSDTSALFAANNEDTGFDFYTLSVNSSGVTLNQDFPSVFTSFSNRIHFDPGTKLIYADEGHVVDPSTGLPAGNFNTSGIMVPDSTLNTAFFIPNSVGSNNLTIESFDLTHFTPISSITIPNVAGGPIRLIRWGQNGLAFITGGFGANGQVFLVGGNFVSPAPPPALVPPPTPPPPATPAANAPVIASLHPSSAIAASAGFTMTVMGTGFDPAATVQFNGNALATSFVSSTQLSATITTGDISMPGTAQITVANPVASGGVSSASTFFIGSTGGTSSSGAGFAVAMVNQASRDIVFDPLHQEMFLSVPNTVTNGNTISVLDPATMKIVGEQFAGSNPDILAISADSQFLYAGIDGSSSVQRFTLPSLGIDLSYPLGGVGFFGPQFAQDLGVAPGAPHTIAVALSAQEQIAIFDDNIARPLRTGGFRLRWGADANTLFAAGPSNGDLLVLSVSTSGVAVSHDYAAEIGVSRLHFDSGTKLVYSDGGHVVDPAAGLPVGNFNTSGLMVPDSSLNTAFFIVGSFGSVTIESFNLTTFTLVSSLTINNVMGNPQRLIRWGKKGLAFNTDGGQIVLIGGDFVGQAPPFALTPPPTPPPLPTPAPNAPVIASLNPSFAIAVSAGFAMTVMGTGFDPAATVQFNGNALATTFVSSTQLSATITAGDISVPGTASITVANPVASGGVSNASTFFIGSSGGVSSNGSGFAVAVVNQAAQDLAFDHLHQEIFLSVPNTVTLGNTISVLDPATTKIVGEQFAGSNPSVLAISDDSQFLYAGINGSSSVQRFTLPSLGIDVNYSLGSGGIFGPNFALDLQVAPGAPHTTAVSLADFGVSPSAQGGITIFDDTTARPTKAPGFGGSGGGLFDSMQWGSDATALFAANNEDTGFDFYTLSVNANGVTLVKDFLNTFSSFANRRIHFDPGTKLVYGDDGHVVDPSNGAVVGNFGVSGLMVPDSSLNTAFFIVGPLGSSTVTIEAFNLTTFTMVSSLTINNVTGNPQRLIRWGKNGLAFNTDGGQVFLVGGNFVH